MPFPTAFEVVMAATVNHAGIAGVSAFVLAPWQVCARAADTRIAWFAPAGRLIVDLPAIDLPAAADCRSPTMSRSFDV